MRRFWKSTLLLLASLSHPSAWAQQRTLSPQVLQAARERLDSELVSGVALGQVRQRTIKNAVTTVAEQDLQIFYDAPKYRVHVIDPGPAGDAAQTDLTPAFQYATTTRGELDGASERLVIFDGEAVYSILSDNGRQRGKVYFAFQQQAALRVAGHPFIPPLHLWQAGLGAKLDPQKLEVQHLNRRGLILKEVNAAYTTKFYFFDDFAFDLRRVIFTVPPAGQPFREISLRWAESNGVQYLTRYAVKDRYIPHNPSDRTVDWRDLEIEFTSFNANAEIAPEVFTLASLALPKNTPFDDHRGLERG